MQDPSCTSGSDVRPISRIDQQDAVALIQMECN